MFIHVLWEKKDFMNELIMIEVNFFGILFDK